jgi:hypothetical protein
MRLLTQTRTFVLKPSLVTLITTQPPVSFALGPKINVTLRVYPTTPDVDCLRLGQYQTRCVIRVGKRNGMLCK